MGLHCALTPQGWRTTQGFLHLPSTQALSEGQSSSRRHSGRGVGVGVGITGNSEKTGRRETLLLNLGFDMTSYVCRQFIMDF